MTCAFLWIDPFDRSLFLRKPQHMRQIFKKSFDFNQNTLHDAQINHAVNGAYSDDSPKFGKMDRKISHD